MRFLLYLLDPSQSGLTRGEQRLTLGLNQGDISAILGATRPKVNLAFQALMASGALRREGDTLVCDVAALERMAEGDTP